MIKNLQNQNNDMKCKCYKYFNKQILLDQPKWQAQFYADYKKHTSNTKIQADIKTVGKKYNMETLPQEIL